ncbi:kelch repeat-containing protein [Duganella sp. Root336D2]|uniref:kelch repeat-containing protein n=1 Tax=Duganella sp. Root336D2 TaxID=1736518 RepID=UPI000AB3EDB0|nr:kelch repeat-containing protein [Duganella sp. Root336D2]
MYPTPLRHLAAAALLACATLSAQAQISTGTMTVPRKLHQTSPLQDGRILVTGGTPLPGSTVYASTEIFDPVTGQFTPAAPMLTARQEHGAVTMQDGRILVAGGVSLNNAMTNSAEIFDPVTGSWSATGNMNTQRYRTIARLLPDGRVMVMGKDSYSTGSFADIFDPATGTFTKTGNYVDNSGWHGLIVLADGRVMKVGGQASTATGPYYPYSTRAEIWDPATNQWTATGPMAVGRSGIQPILLADGKVLVAGGRNAMTLNSTEIYDPATATFSAGPNMPTGFEPQAAAMLPNGDALYLAGFQRQLMHYRAADARWSLTGAQRTNAVDSALSRLPDGNVLISGGSTLNDATNYAAVWDQACAGQVAGIVGSTQTVGSDGGAVNFTVTASPGCRFEAANLPAWLTLAGSNPLQTPASGPATVTFTAAANQTGAARNGSFLLANETVTVMQAASANCTSTPTVSPAISTLTRSGGTGYLNVTASAGCPWTVSAMPSFVTVKGASSGTGNGYITYSAAANPDTAARSGSGQITSLGQATVFSFTQDGVPCPTAPTVTLNSSNFPAAGGTVSGSVNAPATCNWNISLPSWAAVTASNSGNASGSGNSPIAITAAANTGAARNISAAVSGPGASSSFTLSQEGSPCLNWTISPTSLAIPAAGTSSSFTVTAPGSCTWNLSGLPSWLTLTSPGTSSGSGNATLGFTVAANTGAARSATATMSGSGPALSVNLSQASTQVTSCSTPITSGSPVSGLLKSNGCPAGARGSSYYVDRYTFSGTAGKVVTIAMSSSSFDTYLYLRDQAGNVVKSDDDGGGGTNSRISFSLPSTGTYTIEATSYGSNATGAYNLTFTQ